MKLKKRLILSFGICFILAFVTGIASMNLGKPSNIAFATEELPSFFQNDYQNLTYSTSVKNQGATGMCWAFSAVATAEADAIKNHNAGKAQIDLSEWHLAYFLYHGERAGTGDSVSYTNTETPYYSIGGNDTFIAFALSNWIGFANESVAPFSNLQNNLNATISQDKMNECSYKVENVQLLDVSTDFVEMKKAVMEYGAISISYNQSTYYLNSKTYAQYCAEAISADHMVTIVGFDDNYARENFKATSRPKSNGAWLVKNSWGAGWGLDGYFWLSYEDKSISTATVIDVVPASEYDYNYQYDGGISPTYLSHDAGQKGNYANAFTAQSKEILKSVGVYIQGIAEDADNSDYNYTIRVYKNPKTLTPNTFSFSWGTPVSTVTGAFKSKGFLTIPLTTEVYLEKDDIFVIEVETCALMAIDTSMDIEAVTQNGVEKLGESNASILKKQSYEKKSNMWEDVSNKTQSYNFRIKGFSVSTEVGETVIKTSPVMHADIYYGQSLTDDLLSGGTVVDGDTGEVLEGVWSFKDKTKLPYSGQKIEVVFIPNDSRYQTAQTTIYANIYKTKPTITFGEIETEACLGAKIYVKANVINPYNLGLDDFNAVKLYYQIDGGVKNEILNNYFTVPNGMKDGSILTFVAECDGDSYKYEKADSVTKNVTVKSGYRISETPSVSSVVFGESLSSGNISGGIVLNTSSNTAVEGKWIFRDVSFVPSGESVVKLDFVDKNDESVVFATTSVAMFTVADLPEIVLQVEKKNYSVGDKVKITVELKNKYNDSIKDFGKYTLYYIIDGSDEMVKISESKGLIVPNSAKGKKLKIVVVTEAVNDKYLSNVANTEVTILNGILSNCFSNQISTEICVLALLPSLTFILIKGVKNRKEK